MTRPMMGVAMVILLMAALAAGAEANKACGLLTAAELGGALGDKVSTMAETKTGNPDVQVCMGKTSKASILLRIAKGSGNSSNAAAKGVDIAKKIGAQVDVKTFGPITCSTFIPPKNLEEYGFNTTCSVVKGAQVAAVEVTAKSSNDMVPIDKLRPLAEKTVNRF